MSLIVADVGGTNARLAFQKNNNAEISLIESFLCSDFKSLEDRFKALKIANTISGSENNINETRSEINSLIREIDLCISQLSD